MGPNSEQIAAFLGRSHLFQGLTPEKLAAAAACLRVYEKEGGQDVIEQDQPPTVFYFVYAGRLKVTRYSKLTHQDELLGFLDEGDYFGHDLFRDNRRSQVTVGALTRVTLLGLDYSGARELFKRFPELVPRMTLMIESHVLQSQVPLNWVHPEEFVYYITQKHVVFLLARLLPWLLAGVVLVGLFAGLLTLQHVLVFQMILGAGLLGVAGLLVWHYFDWSNDYYIVTGRRVVYQEKVILLYDSRQESPLEQVQSMKVDTSQLGRIFHYGDLTIRTLTATILFKGIRQPQDVMALIQEQQKRTQSSLRQAELRQIEEILVRSIAQGQYRPNAPAKPGAQPKSGQVTRLQKFMADLFHLRYEIGDTIQYRTHWWILVQRIWFVTLLVLAVMVLQVWMLVASLTGSLNGFPLTGMFLGLCLLWVVLFLWWLYVYVDWHNDVYLVNNEQVVDVNKKPLGDEEKKVAQIKNILSVEYKRIGIIGLILNFGTVYIKVGETTFTFDDVFNPSEVQRELFHRISQTKLRERQAQGEADRQRMADWISVYHRITHPK